MSNSKTKKETNDIIMRTDKIILNKKEGDKAFDDYCKKSNNLYNLTMYYIRQSYFYGLEKDNDNLDESVLQAVKEINDFIIKYNEVSSTKGLEFISKENYPMYNAYFLDYMIKNLPEDRFPDGENNPYRELPASVAQQTIMTLCKNWKGYFASLRKWNKNKSKYTGKPKMPKYKRKGSKSFLYFARNGFSLKDNEIRLIKKMYNFQNVREGEKPKQIRVLPRSNHYVIELVYELKNKQEYINIFENHEINRCISIDLGVDNLATITNNVGLKSFIVDGKRIKSINQYYNKLKAKAMSYIGDRGSSNRTLKLDLKRSNMINDKLHKSSKYIVSYCEENDIDTIIIGYNEGWKQNINIGKKNNQKFTYIPFSRFIDQIEYKANEKGIKVIHTQEAYTSKCDALSLEEIKKHDTYKGKRGKYNHRGRFDSGTGKMINSDINGSLNIMRKVIGDEFINIYKDNEHLLTPYRVNID